MPLRLALLLMLLLGAPVRADVTVFAAASLKTALDPVAAGFTDREGIAVTLSYAGSSALARQIERGAPAEIFFSANIDWMDRLQHAGLIAGGTRRDLLGNVLVLIGHDAPTAGPLSLPHDWPMTARRERDRLAMALVDAVPAGIYGKAALTSLGLWEGTEGRVVQTDNVRAALALVALGEAPFGIVYATDARAEPRVHLWAVFPEASHPPIVYPVAAVEGRVTPESTAFLTYLAGAEARALFEAAGFTVLTDPP